MDAITFEMGLVLAILAGAITLFVTEVVRIDVAAILLMVVIGLSGLVPPAEVFAGFSSNAVVSIMAVMIIGGALDRVGVMRAVAGWLLRFGGATERRITASLSLSVGGLSAFMQNIGAAALFLPVAERIGERTSIAPSRLLMPMGFAAILGGTLTLVASGPLILLNDLLASSAQSIGVEIEPYGLFAPTPIGLVLLLGGVAFFTTLGRRFMPASGQGAPAPADAVDHVAEVYGLAQGLRAVQVPSDSPLVGRDVESVEATSGSVQLSALAHHDGLTVAPPREATVPSGAVLGLLGRDTDLDRFVAEHGLEAADPTPLRALEDEALAGLAEVVVRPGSAAVGARLRDLRLRLRYGVSVLAIHRGEEVLTTDLRARQLSAGDVLVVFSTWDRLSELDDDDAFVVLTDHPTEPPRTAKMPWALGFFAVALGLVIATDLQLSLALMTGAIGMLVSGVVSPDEAYRAISWKTVFLLASLIPLGQAVEDTGTAAWIADGVIAATGDLPPWGLQLVIAALATVFTLVVSNVGATVLLVPLAANVAVGVGADPAQFGLIVALAVSNAFLLPTHQVNALLMGPGGYRVVDYLRAGGAMTVLFLVLLIPAVNLFA